MLGEGSYREMCTFLDSEVKELKNGKILATDKDKIKEQMLRIADMVNNKMYLLQSQKFITSEQKDAFVGRFNLVFNQVLQEYGIGSLTQEDINKTMESMIKSKNNSEKNRTTYDDVQLENNNINQEEIPKMPEINFDEMSEDFTINKFGEIEREKNTEDKQNLRQEQETSIFDKSKNKLTMKQKIAKFLQKNNIFMNMSFVEKFVRRQLDVLPSAEQEVNEEIGGLSRKKFSDILSNNGEYKNLPPVQRMSDPEKIAKIQNKMDKKRPIDDGRN